MGYLRLNFWLPAVTDSGESNFLYFKYKWLHEKSTKIKIAFRNVYWDQDKPFNEKKRESKKSRWTVRLTHFSHFGRFWTGKITVYRYLYKKTYQFMTVYC